MIVFFSGSLNVFKRSGLRRPTYAPVPGLSKPSQSPLKPFQVSSVPSQNELETPFKPESASVAPPGTDSNPQNYFKPIGAPPPTVNLGGPLSQPVPTYLPKLPGSGVNLQSPVMDAIPDSEVMDTSIPGNLPYQYANNENTANGNVS